jgi:hypothetical protein
MFFSFPVFHSSYFIKLLLLFRRSLFISDLAFSVSYRTTLNFSSVKMSHDLFYRHLSFSLAPFLFIFVFSSSTNLFFGGKGYT